jgi:hypothetical protein
MCPNEPGRFLSSEHLELIQVVQQESPEFEFVSGGVYDYREEHAERTQALKTLCNYPTIFPQNDKAFVPAEENTWR